MPNLPTWTPTQIAAYLTHGFWDDKGGPRKFSTGPDHVITYETGGMTFDSLRLAQAGMLAWEAVSVLRFQSAGWSGDIVFGDAQEGAWSSSIVTTDGEILQSRVNVSTDWIAYYGTGFDGYSMQSYIHEIGHALGLGHAGPYNGGADYGFDNIYANDSWQASVMSYFNQGANPTIRATDAWVMTPMIADILAIQRLYGVATDLRTGNTTYGDHTNLTGIYANAARVMRDSSLGATFTIIDNGGIDTLDLSGYGGAQRLDLRGGGYSNAYGSVDNIAMMPGTMVENAIGGGGNDLLLGNIATNRLTGGAGNDTLRGYSGSDTLVGGAGADRLEGGTGNDTYVIDARDVIVDEGGFDIVYASGSLTLGAGLEGVVLTGSDGARLIGNALANKMVGNAGNDVLSAGAGIDTLWGGAGNDIYHIGAGDIVIEANGAGHDTVVAYASARLSGGVEDLITAGTDALTGIGNNGANRITGNAGGNVLFGAGGRDTLIGGAGNDTYHMGDGDIIVETAAGGFDRVVASITLALPAWVEALIMNQVGAIDATGNTLNNVLRGNASANRLAGLAGNDSLAGGGGADRFVFDAGRDSILDFQDDIDTVEISAALFGGRVVSVAEALSHGRIEAGDAVFDFEDGHQLRIAGVTRLDMLADDLLIA